MSNGKIVVRNYVTEIRCEHDAYAASAQTALEHAWECGRLLIEVKASLKHGEFGAWLERHEGHLGFGERMARHYMQVMERIPNRQRVTDLAETSIRGLLAIGNDKPHVAHNSGDNEWYTPAEYIAAARETMGGIDLDPASTQEANTIVGATDFYTASENGLTKAWHGRIWLNPPYASEWIAPFAEKLISEYRGKHVTAACVLVNNATETGWFEHMAAHAAAICFLGGRVKFWAPNKTTSAPLQGQAVLYLGSSRSGFRKSFADLGRVWFAP